MTSSSSALADEFAAMMFAGRRDAGITLLHELAEKMSKKGPDRSFAQRSLVKIFTTFPVGVLDRDLITLLLPVMMARPAPLITKHTRKLCMTFAQSDAQGVLDECLRLLRADTSFMRPNRIEDIYDRHEVLTLLSVLRQCGYKLLEKDRDAPGILCGKFNYRANDVDLMIIDLKDRNGYFARCRMGYTVTDLYNFAGTVFADDRQGFEAACKLTGDLLQKALRQNAQNSAVFSHARADMATLDFLRN